MDKFVISFWLVSGLCFLGAAAPAQEEPAPAPLEPYAYPTMDAAAVPSSIVFTVGGKAWFSHIYRDDYHAGNLDMYGGEVNVEFSERFGVGVTCLYGDGYLSRGQRDVNRLDLDLALKYHICSWLTGYLDYKRIDYDYVIPGLIPNSEVKYQEKLNGVGAGLAVAVPVFDTGLFVYAGGGFMPFISFFNFDPLTDSVEADMDYLYNVEGGVGYVYSSKYVDVLFTVGWRLQSQRMILYEAHQPITEDKTGKDTVKSVSAAEEDPPAPVRDTIYTDTNQDGVIAALRISW
ncbi:MAG TPA: hypothetical protein PLI51_09420 [bacterium]|nr:hypothetical protein [bacterium]HPQ66933.1 hypothetical protein [bacterium]